MAENPSVNNSILDRMPDGPIDVYFATNREVRGADDNPEFGPGFHQANPKYLRYGKAEVQPPEEWLSDDFSVLSKQLAPEIIATDTSDQVFGSASVFEELRVRMLVEESDTLIYIHGFANDFDSAMCRAAELKVRYQFTEDRPLNVFAFSWPSDGKLIPYVSYLSDREDAAMSGQAMARSILTFIRWIAALKSDTIRDYCSQNIHLVAHSMGNYALRHAIQAVVKELRGQSPRIFDNVFLMAADEDADTFEKSYKLQALPSLARAVHVYYSRSDFPLNTLSDVTKMNPDRLGTDGPSKKDGLPSKVTLVDCSDVDGTELVHGWHQYYRLRPEVYEDVREVLSGKRPTEINGREFNNAERAFEIIPHEER